MFHYVRKRFVEASTLRGLAIFLAGLCGYSLSDSDAVTLMAAFQILAGLIGAALPDRVRE